MTTYLLQNLSPLLAGVIIATVTWFARAQRGARFSRRAEQLKQSKEALEVHAAALERFLDDPAPARELKRLLISVSDAVADRETVMKMTEWFASRSIQEPLDNEETRLIDRALATLRERRPDLVEDFSTSILTAIVGSCLRWPESAAMIEHAFPRLVTTPKRDVTIAVTATRLRPGAPFSMRPAMPAVA
jgi:hypothetical protein